MIRPGYLIACQDIQEPHILDIRQSLGQGSTGICFLGGDKCTPSCSQLDQTLFLSRWKTNPNPCLQSLKINDFDVQMNPHLCLYQLILEVTLKTGFAHCIWLTEVVSASSSWNPNSTEETSIQDLLSLQTESNVIQDTIRGSFEESDFPSAYIDHCSGTTSSAY